MTRYIRWIPLIAIAVAACSAESGAVSEGTSGNDTRHAELPAVAHAAPNDLATSAVPTSLKLMPPADAKSIAAVRQATSHLADVTITTSQSFKIMNGNEQVATFVIGEGKAPDAIYAGCFAAIVQNGRVTALSTIGSGAWEAETCLSTEAVGILSSGNPVRIGVIYKAASPNAEALEPVLLQWDRAGTLTIDEAASSRASIAGATSVAALRRLLK